MLWEKLIAQLRGYPEAERGLCVAFSGGVDSAVVLRAACESGLPAEAVYFSTALHPARERAGAEALAAGLGAGFSVLEVDELAEAGIENNPPDRCYRCKRLLFQKLGAFAAERGLRVLCDGTNADDLLEYRPGLRALRELSVHSPLAELGLCKQEVRALARARGVEVSGKPSSPCLATRLEYNTPLAAADLERIGRAEDFLKDLGFLAVRVRLHRGLARIEVPDGELERLAGLREKIKKEMKELGFRYITLDLEGLRSGSMDTGLRRTGE
ncbi:MAG: ATP-dependent sacrificial sulfur transferase LarE [Provencibacterium sp.]|jgi:uncharacterized protein|nr:ATP-dependent sacrificial sulfur transferase LarE [Provencibacterium sp.]